MNKLSTHRTILTWKDLECDPCLHAETRAAKVTTRARP
jgi:hypothetical protein